MMQGLIVVGNGREGNDTTMALTFGQRLSKRSAGLMGLGALALALSGCNPGAAVSHPLIGSDVNPSDHLVFFVSCGKYINDSTDNCVGKVIGTIDSKSFASSVIRGTFDNLVLTPNGARNYQDCNAGTACTHSGHFDFGSSQYTATWGTQRVEWEAYGDDFDYAADRVVLNPGVPAQQDYVSLDMRTSGGTYYARTFHCSNECVEVVNKPNPA